MTPTDTIPVTLEAAAWNQVLTLLAEGPYRVAAPLISTIQGQCNQWDQIHSQDNPSGASVSRLNSLNTNTVVPMNEAGE